MSSISLKDRLRIAANPGITINTRETLTVSYSSLELFNTCPRKFELYKIHPMEFERDNSPALSLGSAVGVGYARYLELSAKSSKFNYDKLMDDVLLETWRAYYPPLEDNIRSISKAHVIVQALADEPWKPNGNDDPCDWVLATFNGRPAVELSFCIRLTSSMVYTGYLDGVMYSPSTGAYRPLELKTTSLTANLEVNFHNSSQGLAYALIIDTLSGGKQQVFDVHYRVAQLHRTKAEAYRPTIHDFFFHKTLMDRLEWLIGLQLEVERIGRYLEVSMFPKRGGSCLSWGRPCPFYGICNITSGRQDAHKGEEKNFQFYFKLEDLISDALALVDSE